MGVIFYGVFVHLLVKDLYIYVYVAHRVVMHVLVASQHIRGDLLTLSWWGWYSCGVVGWHG